jgi:rubredoxin
VPVHTCRHCGAPRDADAASAVAWVRERDPDGREHWLCPDCARRHVRDIEAKLPHEWWG